MYKLSFTTMATPELTGIEAIKLAGKYHYDGVDMRVSSTRGELTIHSSDREINELKAAFLSEGIKPSGLLCYNATGTDEPDSWDKMKDSILKNLEIASKLGSKTIRIFIGNPFAMNDREGYINRTADALSEILERDKSGIKLLVQNHRNSISVWDSYQLINCVNHERVGIIFSPEHCLIMNENMTEIFKIIDKITGQFYIADIKRIGKKILDILPGKGDVNIKECYKAIGGKRFSGWITFKWEKIWHPELESAEIALPYFKDYFKALYNRV